MSPSYVERALAVLDEPERLWRIAFESHLDATVQAVLVTLSSVPERAEYDDLRSSWASYCECAAVQRPVGAYERAVRVLDGTFVSIKASGDARLVQFNNPAVGDFVRG